VSGRADLWPLIHRERAALADDLSELTGEQWATPSLCAGLTVREVLAHLTSSASLNGLRWLAGVIRCRFDFDAQVAMRLAEQMGASGADTLARFRGIVESTTSPPLPKPALLGEVIVHGEDIRRPLGIPHDPPRAAVARALRFQVRSSDALGGGRNRVAGVTLLATDTGVRLGEGPVAEGPVTSLLLVASGRRAALADLSGPGAAVLAGRP